MNCAQLGTVSLGEYKDKYTYESQHPSLHSIRRTPSQLHSLQQIPTQHDMLPQHLVYKNELNRGYVITLARNDETP